jgi:hypothetical protein
MRRRSFDDRVRGLVSAGDGTRAGGAAFDAPLMDMVGRALAVPIPRRRALGAISGALLAGSAWRPGRASAAPQECKAPTPKPCDHPGGARVCVRDDFVCCSAPKCALACSPWEDCAAGGACSSSERMCGYPGGPFSDGSARPKFCFVEGPNSTFCNDYSGVVVKDGWCCRAGETCNSGKFGECTCTGAAARSASPRCSATRSACPAAARTTTASPVGTAFVARRARSARSSAASAHRARCTSAVTAWTRPRTSPATPTRSARRSATSSA